MKAVRIHKYGGVDVLAHEEIDVPKIRDNEVLIRVIATSINPIDYRTRDGFLKDILPRQMPVTLGWDVAGIVHQVGNQVKTLNSGDSVYALADITRDGACAEYLAIEASLVAKKPNTLSYITAASLPLAGTTAWQAVIDKADIQPGQRILIHGAAGGVGSLAVQLAKWKKAYVIATASKAKLDYVHSLGADEVIDYETSHFEECVKDVDAVIDPVGGDLQDRSFKVLKPGGRLISLLQPIDQDKLTQYQVSGEFFWVQANADTLDQLARLVDQGHIRPVIYHEFAMNNIAQAHIALESGLAKGKVVVQVAMP